MNTRSTKRSTVWPKPKARAAKTTASTRVTRRQQRVSESEPLEEEEDEEVVVTQEVDSDYQTEQPTEHVISIEYKTEETEETLEEVEAHEEHEEQVVEEQPQQEVYEEAEAEVHHQEVHLVQDMVSDMVDVNQQHLVVDNNQIIIGQIEMTANEAIHIQESLQSMDQMPADLSQWWTQELNQMDGKIEFVCKWLLCSFRTQSECSIRKHVVKHQKPYQCSFAGCGQRFKETALLFDHFSATHMETNAFKCTFADCDQRFKDIKSLTAHRVTHVSHTTQLIKANKDYKPPIRVAQTQPQMQTQTIDLHQIFGHTFDSTVIIDWFIRCSSGQ